MRQRRHVNGNSNATAPTTGDVSTSVWGSGRAAPVNISSTSRRLPAVPTADIVASLKTADAAPINATMKQERKSRAATARRPQSSGGRYSAASCRAKRRVQSARGAGETRGQTTKAEEESPSPFLVSPEVTLLPTGQNSLPKLQSQESDHTTGSDIRRLTSSLRGPPPRSSKMSASGTDANSQVQWAVKVAQNTSGVPVVDIKTKPVTPASPEPVEMIDFRRMLRERYGEKRSVRRAFLTWDINKDGHLSVDELREMLTRLGFTHTLGQNKVDVILEHVSAMPTSSLRYDAFCDFIYSTPELNQSASNTSFSNPGSCKRVSDNAVADIDAVRASEPDCVVSLLRAKYEWRKVSQVFRDWDIDKSGGVTLAELESNLRRQGLRVEKSQLMKLFDTYDLNHDGRLLYDEFMRLVYGPVHEERHSYLAAQRRKRQQELQNCAIEGDPLGFFRNTSLPQEMTRTSTDDPGFRTTLQRKLQSFASRLNDAYAAFDNDHNGNLSYRELSHGLKELGINLTEREFLHLATCVDTDGNGEISFKEFCDVFSGGGGSNRRRSRTPLSTDDGNDRCVEEPQASKPKAQLSSSQRRRAAGTFNFAHLTRRAKIPTRCGRTPYANTKGLISDNQDDAVKSLRFTTEAQLYGSGSSSRSAPAAKVVMTLGQEDNQRRNAAKTSRLQRLRAQIESYEAQTQPQHDPYSTAQDRRVRTLQRHQERYHQRIEEQRPRQALSPARKGIQITRSSAKPSLHLHDTVECIAK